MPIAAIPQGVEIKKLTPTQQKALDKLLRQQRDENTLQTAIRVAIPTVAFVGVAGAAIATTFAYLKDIELPTVKDIVTSGGDLVSDVIVNGVDTIVGKQQPKTPEFLPSGAGPIPICKRWETDYVDVAEQIAQGEADSPVGVVVGALLQKNIIKQMKKQGCERPVIIPATQWDEV
jgi:hypothetical protein